MKPKEKRQLERTQIYGKRRLEIIQAAKAVFNVSGIENTKMTDIADKAELGVASVYRYFKTKPELVIEVGIDYCREMVRKTCLSENFSEKSGIKQISELLDWLHTESVRTPEFFIYLQQFDFYFSNQDNRHPRLEEFQTEAFKLFPHWFDAIKKGVADGTIRKDVSSFDVIALIMRSYTSLQQKVLTRNHILPIDNQIDRNTQLEILKEMIISYLSNTK